MACLLDGTFGTVCLVDCSMGLNLDEVGEGGVRENLACFRAGLRQRSDPNLEGVARSSKPDLVGLSPTQPSPALSFPSLLSLIS